MSGPEPNTDTNTNPDAGRPAQDPAELRRETVDAVASQKQLECRRRAAAELADKLEELAVQALTEDRDVVRVFLDQRVEALKQEESLAELLHAAAARANRLKADLLECGQSAS